MARHLSVQYGYKGESRHFFITWAGSS